MESVSVAVALGSNLGDRRAHLYWAVERLAADLSSLTASAPIETDPVDVPDIQPPYLNAVVVGETSLPAEELMTLLLTLEDERGRQRLSPRAARTLDLDLILYGDRVIDAPGLVVPHPRFRDRAFVLGPLAELTPDRIDPVTGKSMQALWGALQHEKRAR